MFEKIVQIIKTNPHHLELTDPMIEEIFAVGVNYGLFKDENLGFYDKKNNVINLMSTLAKLNNTNFM